MVLRAVRRFISPTLGDEPFLCVSALRDGWISALGHDGLLTPLLKAWGVWTVVLSPYAGFPSAISTSSPSPEHFFSTYTGQRHDGFESFTCRATCSPS
jgi:hypothetical protein